MATTHPLALTDATRFNPSILRQRSRSPSRSPVRKSQFIARELDPLLRDLSPESTLKLLQATATITSEDSKQDALTKSIAEASPAERETGIRAALAAQKLKEWHLEVARWSWPARRDRGWGAGFLPRQQDSSPTTTGEDVSYLGILPTLRVTEYQDRIEDIRDGIEALELEDVKDHVFNTHVPQRSLSASLPMGPSSQTKPTGYGRMRDFTALITATVIQALPELASLTTLLDTWDIRLSVLRSVPDVTHTFRTTRAGINAAYSIVRDSDTGSLVTMQEYEATKKILGAKVASLGSKIDKLLDLLEGQEDSLPKSWIDSLENIENEYAAWVVEAEHVAIRNGLLSKALAEQRNLDAGGTDKSLSKGVDHTQIHELNAGPTTPAIERDALGAAPTSNTQPSGLLGSELSSGTSLDRLSPLKSEGSKKSPLMISTPSMGHNRGKSEISIADSTYSVMSGISTAEIVDATSTRVLSSPKISVVDNPFPAGRDELSWFAPLDQDGKVGSRPPMIQRASTATIEVMPKDSVKQVMLTRSRSHDLLTQTASSFEPSPSSQVLTQPRDVKSSHVLRTEQPELGHESTNLLHPNFMPGPPSSTVSPSPSLRVEPLLIRSKSDENNETKSPELPRRSSKRLSQSFPLESRPSLPLTNVRVLEDAPSTFDSAATPAQQSAEPYNGSLEERIKDILSTMPSKIRLAGDSDGDEARQSTSNSSTRSSTPAPSLTLSPIKADRSGKHGSPGDVRLFHLTRSGQPRDTPPIKLFVRAVGEHGERVMVRVGGGWADLAEYLREYSSHHGHRGLNNNSLEVANFPTSQIPQTDAVVMPLPGSALSQSKVVGAPGHTPTKRRSFPGTSPGPSDVAPLTVSKSRRSNREVPLEAPNVGPNSGWSPPPVPPIPANYTIQMPTTVTTTTDGVTNTRTIEPVNSTVQTGLRPTSFSSSFNGQSISASTSSSPSNGHASYTPLGAAGPKSSGRRVTSHNSTVRESWVDGMVDKARAVSGGTTIIQGPTFTTSTTVITRSTPRSRRVSAMPAASPANSAANSPANSPSATSPAAVTAKDTSVPDRSANRVSLGDMSGIRRVFLRKKSDKS